MSDSFSQKIGVIICSTRKPRICPQVTDFVLSTVETSPQLAHLPQVTLNLVDLQDWNLPLYDEPGIPQLVHNSADYAYEHTRAWSTEIKCYDAYIFVTPQYNWGYPAAIKNAIDYLFNEWTGKPAMIVSYGGHGGGMGAAQLRQVMQAIKMRPIETMPALKYPSRDFVLKAAAAEDLGLPSVGEEGLWSDQRETILKAFAELLEVLTEASK